MTRPNTGIRLTSQFLTEKTGSSDIQSISKREFQFSQILYSKIMQLFNAKRNKNLVPEALNDAEHVVSTWVKDKWRSGSKIEGWNAWSHDCHSCYEKMSKMHPVRIRVSTNLAIPCAPAGEVVHLTISAISKIRKKTLFKIMYCWYLYLTYFANIFA